MKHNLFTYLFLAAWLSLSVGCGGGGSSDDDSPGSIDDGPLPDEVYDPSVFNGSYDISYTLTSNTCTGSAPLANLSETYAVTSGTGFRGLPINEVISSTGIGYTGFSTAGNSDGVSFFIANENGGQRELPNFVTGFTCEETISLRFNNTEVNGNRSSRVTRDSGILCRMPNDATFDFSCEVIYQGVGPIS